MSVLLLLPVPGTAHVLAAAGGYVLGTGRTVPTAAAVVGLVSVIGGGLALARSAGRPGTGPVATVGVLVTALISLGVGGLHALNSGGGPGTGNGLVGALAAVALGVVGTVLGGLALTRSLRTARGAGSVAG